MSDSPIFWFHCGRCGRLFQDRAGEHDDRLCGHCGFDPSLGIPDAANPAAPSLAAGPMAAGDSASGSPAVPHRGKRSVRKRKNRHLMLKLIGGWSLVLAVIVFGARKLWPAETPTTRPRVEAAQNTQTINEEDHKLLQEAGPKCEQVFAGFLTAGIPEQSNQFVLSPVTTASRMARFYSMNPNTQIDPATIGLSAISMLHFPGGRSIETLWASEDGKQFDAVFREDNGEWRLDWEHFARYADYPWALFLAGTGPTEGEFRLLARERLAEERKHEETISLVLYAPRFGQPAETGFQSPEFLVSRSSPSGQLIDAAFKTKRQGRRVFGSSIPDIDPDGMIRLRVQISRSDTDDERRFEITRVLACHWYSIDDPGVDPSAAREGDEGDEASTKSENPE